MQNIDELRKELIENYELLKAGKIDKSLVKELNNTAGKVVSTLQVELKNQYQNGVKKPIPFFEY